MELGSPDPARKRLASHASSVTWGEEASSKTHLEFMRLGHPATFAIPVGYFSVGVAQTLMATPLTYYLVSERNMSSTSLSIISPIMSLPWCFKIAYGMLSDCVPIRGERRRPYFMIGWGSYSILCFAMAAGIEGFSFAWIMFLIFLQTSAYLMSDVAADTMIVERSHRLGEGGALQSTCYLLRFTGGVIGAVVGAVFGDPKATHWFMSIQGFFVACGLAGILPLLFAGALIETPSRNECEVLSQAGSMEDLEEAGAVAGRKRIKSVASEFQVMLGALSHEAVYRPMTFIIVYNVLQLSNASWNNFLLIGLKFSEQDLGAMAVAGSIVTWGGIMVYRRYLMEASWRSVYLGTTLVSLILSFGQLVLISGWNRAFGIGDVYFAAGDTTASTFITAMQFLPAVTMYLSMCPEGAEGSVFALLTTMSNLAGVCASNLSTLVADNWHADISNAAIRAGDYTGVWGLSFWTTVANPLPLLLLFLLPASIAEQDTLKEYGATNPRYGKILLTLVIAAIIWTIVQNTSVALR